VDWIRENWLSSEKEKEEREEKKEKEQIKRNKQVVASEDLIVSNPSSEEMSHQKVAQSILNGSRERLWFVQIVIHNNGEFDWWNIYLNNNEEWVLFKNK
jgi:hypothetical protein